VLWKFEIVKKRKNYFRNPGLSGKLHFRAKKGKKVKTLKKAKLNSRRKKESVKIKETFLSFYFKIVFPVLLSRNIKCKT